MQADFYQTAPTSNEYGYSQQQYHHPPPPKKNRVLVNASDIVNASDTLRNDFDLKKMIGVLIILIIVVFFTVLIGIVVTLMKPGCKCMVAAPNPYFGQVPMNSMNTPLPFI